MVDLLEDALSEITYDASLAGLGYSVEGERTGLLITFGGYNDKLPIFVNTVIAKLKNFEVDHARMKVMIERVCFDIDSLVYTNRPFFQLSRGYENFYLAQPSELAQRFTSDLLSPIAWTPKQKLAELPCLSVIDLVKICTYVVIDIGVLDVERHRQELLSKVYLKALVTGNVEAEVPYHHN